MCSSAVAECRMSEAELDGLRAAATVRFDQTLTVMQPTSLPDGVGGRKVTYTDGQQQYPCQVMGTTGTGESDGTSSQGKSIIEADKWKVLLPHDAVGVQLKSRVRISSDPDAVYEVQALLNKAQSYRIFTKAIIVRIR